MAESALDQWPAFDRCPSQTRGHAQQIDCGDRHHRGENGDLGEEQATVSGADQSRDGAGEKPGIDEPGGEQNHDADRRQDRKPHHRPPGHCRRTGVATLANFGQQQRQWNQRPDPGAGGKEMEHVGGEVQLAGPAGRRPAVTRPGEGCEHSGGKYKPTPAPQPPAPASRASTAKPPKPRREQIVRPRFARTGCGSAPSPTAPCVRLAAIG